MSKKIDWNDFPPSEETLRELRKVIPDNVKLYPRVNMTEKEKLEWYIEELKKDLEEM